MRLVGLQLLIASMSLAGPNVLVYSSGYFEPADYARRMCAHLQGTEWSLQPDSLPAADDADSVMFLGSPESQFLKTRYARMSTLEVRGDSVRVGDTTVVAYDYGLHCAYRCPDSTWVELYVSTAPDMNAGCPSLFGSDFALARRRDGPMYRRDLWCYGQLTPVEDGFRPDSVTWNTLPELGLDRYTGQGIELMVESGLLSPKEATVVLRLLETVRDAYTRQYGVALPDPVHVYVATMEASNTGFSTFSHPLGVVWLRFPDKERLVKPTSGSPVLTIGHEFSWLVCTPFSDAYPTGIGAHDFSEYGPMVGVIPFVDSVLGDSAWFEGHRYVDQGIPRFESTYRGGEGAYGWTMYEVDRQYGKSVIGDAIRQTLPAPHFRHPDMADLMTTLACLTGSDEVAAMVDSGYPSPFQTSLRRSKGWPDLGLFPTLDRMFVDHCFEVDSVVPGSIADSLGFRAGDRIRQIDGSDVLSEKGRCKAHLLRKPKGEPVTFDVECDGAERVIEFCPE